MKFRLRKREPIHAGARRVALEELRAATKHLTGARTSAVALHEVRKSVKRVRALIAFAGPVFGPKAGAVLNARLRVIARQLALHRETDALETLLGVEAQAAGAQDWEMLRAAVRLHHVASVPQGVLPDRTRDINRARRSLGLICRRLESMPLQELPGGEGAVGERLRRSYRRARRAYRMARDTLSADDVHDWRKRGKELLNQTRLLRARGGADLAQLRRDLSQIDNFLGRARDCDSLAHILRGVPVAETPLVDGFGLRARLEAVASGQSRAALRCGAAVFRRRPKSWVRRMFA